MNGTSEVSCCRSGVAAMSGTQVAVSARATLCEVEPGVEV